ncbi:MAG: DNA primase [Candidatus Rokubacteria bacterium]|nr:DNA primase [Candidatus Rokubacteria bacterium]
MVPLEVVDEIRARVDLVDLVGRYVPLKRAGERWKGLCPFHQEKTPSFTVNPKLSIFYCFGCHAGGDAFEFLKRHDRLDFAEAVRVLAAQTGVPLPTRPEARAEAGVREGLYRVMDWAARRFEHWLWEGEPGRRARQYLADRGIAHETARAFRLGYVPEGWDHVLTAAGTEGFGVETLLAAGLVLPRQTGSGHYDRFRGRLIFPIADGQGRVIAFGGRALAGEEPKYLNSPDTPLYQKGQILYALHLARERMTATRRALLVEGYIDCLMTHQAGFAETVAVLGTALTVHHLGLLRRYADETVLFFDADRAGTEAARRAEELLEQSADPHWWAFDRKPTGFARSGLRLRVATLPAGHDPDTFLRQDGPEAFAARCAAARNLLLYAIDRIFAEEDPASPRGKATGMARVALLLAKVQDADEAIELGREAARRLGIDPSDLWNQAQRLQAAARRPARTSGPEAAPGAAEPVPAQPPPASFDRDLVQLLLQVPGARVALAPLAEPQDVGHPALARILAALQAHPQVEPAALVQRLEGEAERVLLTRLLVEERPWLEPQALVEEIRRRLDRRRHLRRIREIRQAITKAETDGAPGLADLQVALQDAARQVRELTARSGREDRDPERPGRPAGTTGGATPAWTREQISLTEEPPS